jgi:hypothetical protein
MPQASERATVLLTQRRGDAGETNEEPNRKSPGFSASLRRCVDKTVRPVFGPSEHRERLYFFFAGGPFRNVRRYTTNPQRSWSVSLTSNDGIGLRPLVIL